MIDMVDPYAIIEMPWITEKTLEARRVADQEGGYRETVSYTHLTLPTKRIV